MRARRFRDHECRCDLVVQALHAVRPERHYRCVVGDFAHHFGCCRLNKHIPRYTELLACLNLPEQGVQLANQRLVLRRPVQRGRE